MSKHQLSKSTYIRGLQCLKSLYFHKHRPFLRDRLSPEQLQKFKRGTEVGKIAQSLFPGGLDMSARSPAQYAAKVTETRQAIDSKDIDVLYEAAFQYDDVLIFLDILVRTNDGWVACEVKSSRSLSAAYYSDAALQYYVLKGSGVHIADFFLFYINGDYILDNALNLSELFKRESVYDLVENKLNETKQQVASAKLCLQQKRSPDIAIGTHCNDPYPCDFRGFCWKNVPKLSILQLTAFDEDQIFEWYHSGISDPRQVAGLSLNDLQKNQIEALNSRTVFYDQDKHNLPKQNQNIAFIELFFIRPAIPVISGTKPYAHIPLASGVFIDGVHSDVVYFNSDVTGISLFLEWLNNLAVQFEYLIVFDKGELGDFLKTDLVKSLTKNHFSEKFIEFQLVGLRQFMDDIRFFYPGLASNVSIEEVSLHLLNGLPKLSDRHQLIVDILKTDSKNDNEQNRQKILEYLMSLQSLYIYLSKLKS
jgi:hypothetical protein